MKLICTGGGGGGVHWENEFSSFRRQKYSLSPQAELRGLPQPLLKWQAKLTSLLPSVEREEGGRGEGSRASLLAESTEILGVKPAHRVPGWGSFPSPLNCTERQIFILG